MIKKVDWTLCLVADVESAGDRDLIGIIPKCLADAVSILLVERQLRSAGRGSFLAPTRFSGADILGC